MYELNEYLSNYFDNKVNTIEFLKYIERSPSNSLLCFLAPNQREKYLARIEFQNILDNVLTNEICNLEKYLRINHISVIGLKGPFLQNSCHQYRRIYKDVDLLIQPKDFCVLREYFVSNGYMEKLYKGERRIKKHYNFMKMNHLELEKKIVKNNTVINITFELHGTLNHLCKTDFSMEYMVYNSHESQFGKFVRLLNLEDNMLFLMYHTIKHLPYVYNVLDELSIGMQKFTDVFYLISYNDVNWNKFLERAYFYKVAPFAYLYLYVFTDIFKDIVPEIVMQELLKLSSLMDFTWKNIFYKVLKINPYNLLIGNYNDLNEIYSAYIIIKQKYGNFDNFGNKIKEKQRIWNKALNSINNKEKT